MGLTTDAAEFFLEMIDNSTDQLRMEAQKLLAFFERGATISLDDLEHYLVHSREENVFTLFEKITEAQFPKALEVLKKMIASKETEGIGLLGGLTWQFKNLLAFQVKLMERNPAEEAFNCFYRTRAQNNSRQISQADRSLLIEHLAWRG